MLGFLQLSNKYIGSTPIIFFISIVVTLLQSRRKHPSAMEIFVDNKGKRTNLITSVSRK